MDEWRSIDEFLPSLGAPVFVCSKSLGVKDGMLASHDHRAGMLIWVIDGTLCFDITHWMPKHYPKPPQGE